MNATTPIAAALATALGLAAPLAAAQTNEAAPQAPLGEMTPYEEPTLRAFAEAAVAVRGVLENYGPELEAAASAEERSRLEREASEAMRRTVNDTDGITVEKYVEISRAAQKSDTLAKTISRYMEEV